MLEELGLPFAEINQDNLHKGCWGKNFSSPTLLARFDDNDIIVFGGPRQSKVKKESSELAYLKNVPNKKELRALLEWV